MGSREHVGGKPPSGKRRGAVFNDVRVYEIGNGELSHFGGESAFQ